MKYDSDKRNTISVIQVSGIYSIWNIFYKMAPFPSIICKRLRNVSTYFSHLINTYIFPFPFFDIVADSE